ncbi:MAG: ThiF family adenylyltransferase [Nitrosotalea sp.]
MKYSVAIPAHLDSELLNHLIREDGQEDAMFCLWVPSCGKNRYTALLNESILPLPKDRDVHGNVTISQEYFLRVLNLAQSKNTGLAFMHSHVGPGWQQMSRDDVETEEYFAPRTYAVTELPLLGLTVGNDGTWSARFWNKVNGRKYQRDWCENIRIVGHKLRMCYNNNLLQKPEFRPEFERTVTVWGDEIQAKLMRLKIGIIGVGGVGSIIAETLARMGVMNILLMDFDSVECINLDRILHATKKDVGNAKVKVISRALERSATASKFWVGGLELSVTEPDGFRHALDCDVLFSCVDRPWPRSVLNFIAYSHLIPVIDGGVQVRVNSEKKLKKANFGAHIASPYRRCLACLEQYDPGLVAVEKDGLLDDPSYIRGLPEDSSFRHNENVFSFNLGAASLEILQFLSMVVSPHDISNVGAQKHDFVTGNLNQDFGVCEDNCPFPELVALGDRSGFDVTSRHKVAELARKKREEASRTSFFDLIRSFFR